MNSTFKGLEYIMTKMLIIEKKRRHYSTLDIQNET